MEVLEELRKELGAFDELALMETRTESGSGSEPFIFRPGSVRVRRYMGGVRGSWPR